MIQKLLSHPDKELQVHLINVCNLMLKFLNETSKKFYKILFPVVPITGLFHDIGKATTSFQKYITRIEKEKTKHSLFSAVISYYITKKLLKNTLNNLIKVFFPFFVYIAVKRHHSDLHEIEDEFIFLENNKEEVLEQLNDIDNKAFYSLFKRLIAHLTSLGFKTEFLSFLLSDEQNLKQNITNHINEFSYELEKLRKQWKDFLKEFKSIELYFTLNLLFSLLIDADKMEAGIGTEYVLTRSLIDGYNLVDRYLEKKVLKNKNEQDGSLDSDIFELRNCAYECVMRYEIDSNKKIFLLNLPTGSGKTLTGFAFALKLREMLYQNQTPPLIVPRIIYVLPFLSIIDQNSQVLSEVLKVNEIIPTSDVLLVHHHLSDLNYQTSETKYDVNQSQLLIESWNSQIIVTTFIQFFHTLFAYKNSMLKKFHRFANSIVILDEVQAIPLKYWKLVSQGLKELTEHLNVRIILMTATLPPFFEEHEVEKLIPNNFVKDFQKKLNRYVIYPEIDKERTLKGLYEELKPEIFDLMKKGKKILFVLNTIKATKEFYKLLKEIPVPLYCLNTHIIPKHRLERIKKIQEHNGPCIVVATQLIEAGVDIDFDFVVRDIAPLECIVQTAGRCNRHALKEKGIVKIYKLIDEKGRLYATNQVYNKVLINKTEKLLLQALKEKITIEEFQVHSLLKSYFDNFLISEESDVSEEFNAGEKIMKAVLNLIYQSDEKNSIQKFRLIEERGDVDVFVEWDEEAKEILQRFYEILKISSPFQRKIEFLKIRKNFYDYVISIPFTQAENLGLPFLIKDRGNENMRLFKIPFEGLEVYYDVETGLRNSIDFLKF